MGAEADFSGWATKAGLKCSDGRTIMPDAFKHMDGMTVPLVWQHGHNSTDNVLGHAILQNRPEGVYAFGFFNDTPAGVNAKKLVAHKDITSLSIWANGLVERSKQVFHGIIRELSLVLSGANPGALIDFVSITHADGDVQTLDDEAVIYTGLELEHEGMKTPELVLAHAAAVTEETLQDVYNTLNEQQTNLLHYMLGVAAASSGTPAAHSATQPEDDKKGAAEEKTPEGEKTPEVPTTTEGNLTHQEGSTTVTRNVFEQQSGESKGEKHILTHDAMKGIFTSAQKSGSMKAAVEEYALAHGIDNIDILFPDARAVSATPEFDKRRTEWVASVINGTTKSPFSRIKSFSADITQDEARARGYIKGKLKKEEFFGVTKRVTTPTTMYKKQKLDRDDIIDVTDFDVVAWMKAEMRVMLDEELARAVLIGDGRDVDDEDKIRDPAGNQDGAGIRSILNDADLYAATVNVNLDDASSSYTEFLDEVINTRRLYKGSGLPTFYTTEIVLAKLLTLRDGDGHRMFRNLEDLSTELRVAAIVPVEPMETIPDLLGIMVNLKDYTMGADKGGEVNLFDDFDIDYNQYKYLIEGRCSGALTKLRSALIYRKVAAGAALVVPVSPDFDPDTNIITPATTTGVTYKRADTNATVTTGAPITLDSTTLTSLTIYAIPASGSYYIENNVEDEWTFNYQA